MFLHIGAETEISFKDIVLIIDLGKSVNKITSEFINRSFERNEAVKITDKKPKSMIVVHGINGQGVYLSPISAAALKRRYNILADIMSRNLQQF